MTHSLSFMINMKSLDGTKEQIVWKMIFRECSGDDDKLKITKSITVECTCRLLDCLLQMMGLSSSVKIRHKSGKTFEVIVHANAYTSEHIPMIIGKMCSNHTYWNISSDDAYEIIRRLDLSQYVFCVQGDPALGACLVVLQDLGLSHYHQTHLNQEEPRTTFRKEYERINQSRTVYMTQAQFDALLSGQMKLSVEFSSVLPDRRIEVVFRRESIQNVVPEIKKRVEICNLLMRLKELISSSK